MSTSVEEHEYAEMNVEAKHHSHPSDMFYVRIFGLLVVLTGIEVALSYVEVGGEHLTIGLLIVFAALKFGTVVAYFMHLKFDHPWFRRLFIAGLVLAVGVYVAYLSTLHVWHR
jgi:cytochrome c oxidase subunit IV